MTQGICIAEGISEVSLILSADTVALANSIGSYHADSVVSSLVDTSGAKYR